MPAEKERNELVEQFHVVAELLTRIPANASHRPVAELGARISAIVCPSLSLLPAASVENHARLQRDQAEKHAGALLGREITHSPSEWPKATAAWRDRLYEALALLVESRLRAYVTVLEQHAKKSQQVVASGDDLYSMARLVDCQRMAMRFTLDQPQEQNSAATGRCSEEALPFQFSFDVDLALPMCNSSAHPNRSLKVCVTSSGLFFRRNESLHVTLHTPKLLSSIMKQAAKVVSSIVKATQANMTIPRSPSYLAMPPPQARPRTAGLDMLCEAIMLPVVSPDLKARRHAQAPPVLQLDAKEDDDVVDKMSPDQCADVVDNIFDDGSLDAFLLSPPKKKLRSF